MKGVVDVRVHFAEKEVEVDYRPDETTAQAIAEALPKVTDDRYHATVKSAE